MKKLNLLTVLALVTALFTACLTGCAENSPPPPEGFKLTLSKTEMALNERDKETLTFTATMDGETVTDDIVNFSWSSDKPNIATIDKYAGLVTAVAEGAATLTLSYIYGGETGTAACALTVSPFDTSGLVITFNITAGEGFTASMDKVSYSYGETAVLTVTPAQGYALSGAVIGSQNVSAQEFTENGGAYTYSFTCSMTVESVTVTVETTDIAPSSFSIQYTMQTGDVATAHYAWQGNVATAKQTFCVNMFYEGNDLLNGDGTVKTNVVEQSSNFGIGFGIKLSTGATLPSGVTREFYLLSLNSHKNDLGFQYRYGFRDNNVNPARNATFDHPDWAYALSGLMAGQFKIIATYDEGRLTLFWDVGDGEFTQLYGVTLGGADTYITGIALLTPAASYNPKAGSVRGISGAIIQGVADKDAAF